MKNRKKREKAKSKKVFLRKVIGVIAVTAIGVAAYSVGSELGILPSLEQSGAEASEEIFHVDFNNRESEVYSQNELKEDFKNLKSANGQNRMSIKYKALCMEMPEGKAGVKDSGAQVNFSLSESKEYTVEYKVFFDGDGGEYDWSDSGTLCGISSNNYDNSKKGYNVSLKWSKKGEVRPYIQTKDGVLDEDKKIGGFTDNLWHYVKMYVKKNDLGKGNGIVRIWIDGVLGYDNNKIDFGDNDDSIDKANITAYHDGVTQKKQYVYIDDYKADPENREVNGVDSNGSSGDKSDDNHQKNEENKALSVSLKQDKGKSKGNCYVSVYVNNNSDKKVDNWTMQINSDKVNIASDSVCGAEMEKKENCYVIKPKESNKVIKGGGRVGFSFKTDENFEGLFDCKIY